MTHELSERERTLQQRGIVGIVGSFIETRPWSSQWFESPDSRLEERLPVAHNVGFPMRLVHSLPCYESPAHLASIQRPSLLEEGPTARQLTREGCQDLERITASSRVEAFFLLGCVVSFCGAAGLPGRVAGGRGSGARKRPEARDIAKMKREEKGWRELMEKRRGTTAL
jgi:hypothetical protein